MFHNFRFWFDAIATPVTASLTKWLLINHIAKAFTNDITCRLTVRLMSVLFLTVTTWP